MKSIIKAIQTMAIFLFLSTSLHAQDGEALFKSKCNACHLLDKNSTGPMLKDVKKKWADASEDALLVDWVKNSAALIAGGKSKMANEIKGFSAMEMPAQEVTTEDVDAILTFVDNYVPKEVAETPPSGNAEVTKEIKMVPNYKQNLTFFYLLITIFILLIAVIFIMTNATTNMVKHELFKTKMAEKKDTIKTLNSSGIHKTILTLIAFFGLMVANNNSFALSYVSNGEIKENSPWLLVEMSDIYFLIIIDCVLIGIVFYIRKLFKDAFGMIYSLPEKVSKRRLNLNKIVNDIVPIEEEHTILMHHEYDGIRELDNNLPPWWVWGFIATIIFAVYYLFDYHVFKTSDLQVAAYNKEMKTAEKEVKAYLSKMSMNVDETNATLMVNPEDLTAGKSLFETNCVTCHNPKGEGNIGPNLTDKNWIYGFDVKDVFKTIKTGTANGMPEHSSKFNPIQIQQVASFVLSLPETKGKEAQGTIIK